MTNWAGYLRPGFERLKNFQAESINAEWKQGDYDSIQLEVSWRVLQIIEPVGEAIPAQYKSWYSTGKKGGWQITNGGRSIWNAKPDAGFVDSSKFGELIHRCVELNAPMIQNNLKPEDANTWIGMVCMITNEDRQYEGMNDSTIDLPTQFLNAGQAPAQQPPPQQQQQAVPPTAAPPQAMAPPPPVMPPPSANGNGASNAAAELDVHMGPNKQQWSDYLKSLVQGKDPAMASSTLKGDANFTMKDSKVAAAVNDDSIWGWLEANNVVKLVAGTYV